MSCHFIFSLIWSGKIDNKHTHTHTQGESGRECVFFAIFSLCVCVRASIWICLRSNWIRWSFCSSENWITTATANSSVRYDIEWFWSNAFFSSSFSSSVVQHAFISLPLHTLFAPLSRVRFALALLTLLRQRSLATSHKMRCRKFQSSISGLA